MKRPQENAMQLARGYPQPRAIDYALKTLRSYLRTPRKEMDIPIQDNLGIKSEILGGLSYAITK